jgi:hypothetical protein
MGYMVVVNVLGEYTCVGRQDPGRHHCAALPQVLRENGPAAICRPNAIRIAAPPPPWRSRTIVGYSASVVSGKMTDKGVHHIGHPRGFTRIRFRLSLLIAGIHYSIQIHHVIGRRHVD